MMNSIDPGRFYSEVQKLRQDLRSRGYPESMLSPPMYDTSARLQFLQKMHLCDQPIGSQITDDSQTVVLTILYGTQLKGWASQHGASIPGMSN